MRIPRATFLLSLFLSTLTAVALMTDEEARSWARDIIDKTKPPEVTRETRYWTDMFLPPDALARFRGNPAEQEFLRANASALLVIKNSACSALSITYALCDVQLTNWDQVVADTNDEETDAIRHFYMSAAISCSRGAQFANTYMTLHEGAHPQHYQARELMDIKNNRLGAEWGANACRSLHGNFDEQAIRAALTKLKERGLATLGRGRTACADPDSVLRRGFADLREKQQKVNAWMRANRGICK